MKRLLFLLPLLLCGSLFAQTKIGAIPETGTITATDRFLTVPVGQDSNAGLLRWDTLCTSLAAISNSYNGTFTGSFTGNGSGLMNVSKLGERVIHDNRQLQTETDNTYYTASGDDMFILRSFDSSNGDAEERFAFFRNNYNDDPILHLKSYGSGSMLWLESDTNLFARATNGRPYWSGDFITFMASDTTNRLGGVRGDGQFYGNGLGLTNLPMTSLVGTQLNFGEGATITRGPGEVLEFSTEIVGTHVGTGDGLTNLNASALASGTLAEPRLPRYWGGITNAGSGGTDLSISANGRVGIGVSTPSYKLDVANGVHSGKVLIGAVDNTINTSSGDVLNLGTVGVTRVIVQSLGMYPYANNVGTLGASTKNWNSFFVTGLTVSNGNSVMTGNLTVSGTGTASNFVATAVGGTSRAVDWSAQTNAYDDIVINLTSLDPPGATSPGTLVWTNGPSADMMAIVFAANQQFHVNPQMPHTWVPGTTVFPHLHVEPQTANSITNVWEVYYQTADIGGTFGVTTAVTNQVILAAAQQYKHLIVSVPTNGISMAGKTGPSTMMKLHYVLRTTSEPTHLISFDVHYRTGGSPTPYNAP